MSPPKFLLDTNVLSELGKPDPDESVAAWMWLQPPNASFYISAVTVAEVEYGIAWMNEGKNKRKKERAMQAVLNSHIGRHRCLLFDDSCVKHYIAVSKQKGWGPNASQRRSKAADMMIAAIALRHRLVLATRNTKDFDGIDNLAVINPWKVKI